MDSIILRTDVDPVDRPITVIGATGNAQIAGNLTVIGSQSVTITGKADITELQKQTREHIQLWTHDTVEPSALHVVLGKIRTGSGCVTITGSPGEGKSTLGYLVLGKLQESRNVFDVSSPEQFAEVIKTRAPVILLDDIFGQTVFNETDWKQWKYSLQQFIDMKEHTPINEIGNLVFIARDFVINSGSRNTEDPWEMLINKGNVVNISSEVVRGNEEKHNILNSIAKRYNVHLDSETIKTICSSNTPHGFPHACKLFVTLYHNKISAVNFFSNPLEFLNKSLKIIIKDKVIEHIFMEMMKGDGNVCKCELSKCGSEYITTANDLCPTYIKPDRKGYVFDHPSILDTVAFLLCETKLSFILDHCSMKFIQDRVWLQTPDRVQIDETNVGAKLMAQIPWNEAEEFVARFVKEIVAGNVLDVMYHSSSWESNMFVTTLIENMTPDELNVGDKWWGDTLLHQLCRENRADCVKTCVQRGADVNRKNLADWTPLQYAALWGSTNSVCVLLEHGANVNITDIDGNTALDLATQGRYNETVSVLRAEGGYSGRSLQILVYVIKSILCKLNKC